MYGWTPGSGEATLAGHRGRREAACPSARHECSSAHQSLTNRAGCRVKPCAKLDTCHSGTLRNANWPARICHMAGTNEAEAVSAASVLKLLGGLRQRAKRLSPPEVRDAVRNGLPYSSLEALQTALELSLKELSAILGIPERTIARRKDEQHLTAAESDRLYRVARTLAHAASVLGTTEKARLWLKRPNRALGEEAPLTLLDTDLGARQVEETLFRIVYGIHS